MTEQRLRWTRLGLVYLTATYLQIGLWATFATRSFYDDFPGFGRRWLAGDGPYNAHLASDAGVGFLAVAVVLLLAAIWMEHRVVQAALVAAMLHGLLHLLFHLVHPNEDLGVLDALLSDGGLLLGVSIAAILLTVVTRTPVGQSTAARSPASREDTTPADNRSGRWEFFSRRHRIRGRRSSPRRMTLVRSVLLLEGECEWCCDRWKLTTSS